MSLSVAYSPSLLKTTIQNFMDITKFRLSVSVVFSSVAGYLLGAENIDFAIVFLLSVGGYCMVGASNVFNQIIERDLDALMNRTKNRPLPAGKMTVKTAFILGVILTIVGLVVLYNINPITALFGAVSIFMYVSLYTPLKTKTPLSVFVGAFPGAIPFMLGWVAASGSFGIEPGTLFLIQFFWQFPHFWAIGWFLYDDYERGGFFMLPNGKKNKGTAIQIIMYCVWTVVASLIPAFGITGKLYLSPISAVLVGLLGGGLIYYSIKLFQELSDAMAKKLMLASVSYITLLQLIFVLDKFIR
ncbi:MAG TPA: heme o synthase [Flavobacteriaceae bacterium]|nr:heme o synthase [Flavobacteriaceae bacterium]